MNKLKVLITVIVIVSILSCISVVSAIDTTEPATNTANTATSDELVTDDYTDALPVLTFTVSCCLGVLLGKAFSFWKW